MSDSTVRFALPCYAEAWDASYDGVIAAKYGCLFVSESVGTELITVVVDAPSQEAAEGFVTEIFSCDESCTAEELMVVM